MFDLKKLQAAAHKAMRAGDIIGIVGLGKRPPAGVAEMLACKTPEQLARLNATRAPRLTAHEKEALRRAAFQERRASTAKATPLPTAADLWAPVYATLLKSPEGRWQVAYHEAGHACMAQLLLPGQRPVKNITLFPDGGGLGHVEFADCILNLSPVNHLLVKAAGRAGVDIRNAFYKRFTGRTPSTFPDVEDFRAASVLLGRQVDEADQEWKDARCECFDRLSRSGALQAVAEAVHQYGRLPGREFVPIFYANC